MLRNARHTKILELIDDYEIETQEDLCEYLEKEGYSVTQATVSRDIRELHLFKVAGSQKRYRYAAISKVEGEISDKMRLLFQACIEKIYVVENIIVVKTLNGNGMNAAAVIDRLNIDEIAGTIGSVDTVFTVCKTKEGAQMVKERLDMIIRE